jgi:lycopene cyclase domain-containing protein
MNSLYLYLNISAIALPLLLSFDKKVAFYKNWKYLFPAIAIMAAVFIGWDVLFTKYGVWGFNERYLTGPHLLGLPIEEWLFFFTVPYACIFIYECLKAYLNIDPLQKIHRPLLFAIAGLLILIAIFNYSRIYTSVNFMASGLVLIFVLLQKKPWLSMFFLAYLISLIPFLLLNGILTGSFIEEEVVWYNSSMILNIRVLTIPIEDSIYNLFMLLATVYLYESFKRGERKTNT